MSARTLQTYTANRKARRRIFSKHYDVTGDEDDGEGWQSAHCPPTVIDLTGPFLRGNTEVFLYSLR
jgi:hypothetical protein